MKKLLVTTAAMSLMLLACNGDTSVKVSGDETITDTNVQSSQSIPRGNVIANIGECGLNSAFFGKAYMTNTDNGGFQIVVPDMHVDDEWHDDELLAERVGDTLHVWEEREYSVSLNWICYAHHTFDISAEDSDVKYFKYFNQVFEVVPGPAPEKKPDIFIEDSTADTIIQKSDSTINVQPLSSSDVSPGESSSSGAEPSSSVSAKSSSSVSAKSSSSSAAKVAGTHQVITDAQNRCTANTDTTAESYAYRYVSTERTGFTLENLKLTYGIVADTLDVDVSGDTVYVKAVFDFTNAQRMYCQSTIDFAVDNNPAFAQARFVAFYQNRDAEPILLKIVDMDVITVEEATRQYAKDIAIECKNDRQTLNRPALQAVTLLPDFDTTSTKHIAGRVVGDDGFDMILINELDVGCGVENVNFEVSASNDTLYVQPSAGLFGTNCICPSRINFKIEQNSRFSNTNVLVFGHFEPMPLVTAVRID